MVTMLAVEQNPHEMPGYQTSLRLSRLIENLDHGAKELRGARRGDEDGQAIWIWSDLGFGGLLGGAEIGQGDGDILWLQAEPVSLGAGQGTVMPDGEGMGAPVRFACTAVIMRRSHFSCVK